MRKADPKHFKNILVDESNILNWKGLIVPVSQQPCVRDGLVVSIIHEEWITEVV